VEGGPAVKELVWHGMSEIEGGKGHAVAGMYEYLVGRRV